MQLLNIKKDFLSILFLDSFIFKMLIRRNARYEKIKKIKYNKAR